MLSQIVSIWVKPECIAAFIETTHLNHLGTRQESGNRRFDVMQDVKDPGFFTLFEVFVDEVAIEAHRKSPHYLKWRESVESMMAKPRVGILHKILFPSDASNF